MSSKLAIEEFKTWSCLQQFQSWCCWLLPKGRFLYFHYIFQKFLRYIFHIWVEFHFSNVSLLHTFFGLFGHNVVKRNCVGFYLDCNQTADKFAKLKNISHFLPLIRAIANIMFYISFLKYLLFSGMLNLIILVILKLDFKLV